jgi:hypothetical protein
MIGMARTRLLLAAGAALLVGRTAFAQDAAAASELFERGLADMLASKFETGCPALAESYRLDPQAGALFTLAECEAQWGRIASAVTHYDEYLVRYERMNPRERAAQRDRPTIASTRRDALHPEVPRLTLTLPKGAPAGTEIERGGVKLTLASLGVPLPIDPGEHLLTVRLPDGAEREQRVTIGRGEQKTVELLLPAAATASPSSVVVPTGETAPASDRDRISAETGTSPWLYVAGAVALVGFGVGATGGVLAMNRKQEIDANCEGTLCNDAGLEAAEDAKRYALVSTIGFGVGAAALATGVVLLLSAPSSPPPREARALSRPSLRPTALVGTRGASIGLEGGW